MTATPRPENDDDPQHETVFFAFDRMTVARFRETFPNARWSDALKTWTVPGSTARRRIDRWLASEMGRHDPYEQERGRDAYEFEPILSSYLEVTDTGFRIRTAYSKPVVDELRQIPFARWNGDEKVWEVPYASYDDLQPGGRRSRRPRRGTSLKSVGNGPRRERAPSTRRRSDDGLQSAGSDDCLSQVKTCRHWAGPWPQPPSGTSSSRRSRANSSIPRMRRSIIRTPTTSTCGWDGGRPPWTNSCIYGRRKRGRGEYERLRGWWQPDIEELRSARSAAKSREMRKLSSSK